MQIAAWALDELTMPDIFPTATAFAGGADDPPSTEAARTAQLAAQHEAERQRREAEAYARGRDDAERAIRAECEAAVADALGTLATALESVRVHEARWLANVEENLAALAVIVARHIVLREVEADPQVVREVVRRALAQLPIDQPVTVRINPDDLAACAPMLSDGTARLPDVRWLADAAITRGGCLVEGRERVIDGRVDMALERAYRSLGNVQA